jgi:hypothetical protein
MMEFVTSVYVDEVRFAVTGNWSPPVVDPPDPVARGDIEIYTVQVDDSEIDIADFIEPHKFDEIEQAAFDKLCREKRGED